MPKELFHRYVATSVAKRLPNSPLKSVLERNMSYLEWGSISPDSLFCYEARYSRRLDVNSCSRFAHNRTNTLAFLNDFLAGDEPTGEEASFLVGAAMHVVTDVTFHPFIYYFCGYEALAKGSMRRHYRLETLLDMLTRVVSPHSLAPLSMPDVLKIERAFNLLHFGSTRALRPHAARDAIRAHALFMKLFHKKSIRQVAKILHTDREALFYYPAPRFPLDASTVETILEKRFHYKTPVAGVDKLDSIHSLTEQAIELGLTVLNQLSAAPLSPSPVVFEMGDLETGVVGTGPGDMRYFNVTDPDELLDPSS